MKILPWLLGLLGLATPLSAIYIDDTLHYQGRVSVQGVNFNGPGQFKFALVDAGTPFGSTATATATVDGDAVTAVNVDQTGANYLEPPLITFSGPGSGATAVATLDLGIVTSITVTNGGSGYTTPPVVTISPPPAGMIHSSYWSNDGTSTSGDEPQAAVEIPVVNGFYSVQLGGTAPDMTRFDSEIFAQKLHLRVWFNDGTHGFQQLAPDQPLASAPYALQARLSESVPPNSIGSTQIANGAVTAGKLADASVGGTSLASGAVVADKLADGAVTTAKLAAASVTSAILAPGAAAENLNVGNNQALSLGNCSFGRVTASVRCLFTDGLSVVGPIESDQLIAGRDLGASRDVSIGRNLTVFDSITYVGNLTDLSDERLKDLGSSFDAGLEAITRIQPLHYRFKKDNPLGIPSDRNHVGVSAQALRNALPEAVVERGDAYLGVSQEPVVWALVNAAKELKAENEALKARLEALEAKLK